MALAGVGQHFSRNLDQYTIMCVFGSVVGCVVLPLMAHSLESLIITAILFGVTVKTLKKKPHHPGGGGAGGGARDVQEERKKDKRHKKCVLNSTRKHPPSSMPAQGVVDGEVARQQRELDLMRREEIKMQEKEQKMEEKRKKKAKKREEKLQKREEEKLEKEKQEAVQQQRRKERDQRKRKPAPISDLPDLVVPDRPDRPVRRERKHSTSSSTSSGSSYSTPPLSAPPPRRRRPPPKLPVRASSAPLISATPSSSTSRQQPLVAIATETPQVTPPRHHAPLQMMQAVTLLPFLAPQQVPHPQVPHPHFVYGPVPSSHFQADHTHLVPRPLSQNWSGSLVDSDSMQTCSQPAATGHVTGQPACMDGRGSHVTASGCGPPDHAPLPTIMSGPAQGFYSFLNDQALNSDPSSSYQISSSASIWTPSSVPPASQSQGEGQEAWPQWPSTQ